MPFACGSMETKATKWFKCQSSPSQQLVDGWVLKRSKMIKVLPNQQHLHWFTMFMPHRFSWFLNCLVLTFRFLYIHFLPLSYPLQPLHSLCLVVQTSLKPSRRVQSTLHGGSLTSKISASKLPSSQILGRDLGNQGTMRTCNHEGKSSHRSKVLVRELQGFQLVTRCNHCCGE